MQRRISGYKKAGLSGLLLLCLIASANAEPLVLHVQEASIGTDQRTQEPTVNVRITEESKQALTNVTRHNVGKPMELRIDGKAVFTPVIREPLLGVSFVISGSLIAIRPRTSFGVSWLVPRWKSK